MRSAGTGYLAIMHWEWLVDRPRLVVFFFKMTGPPPSSPLFPYAPLFRSEAADVHARRGAAVPAERGARRVQPLSRAPGHPAPPRGTLRRRRLLAVHRAAGRGEPGPAQIGRAHV